MKWIKTTDYLPNEGSNLLGVTQRNHLVLCKFRNGKFVDDSIDYNHEIIIKYWIYEIDIEKPIESEKNIPNKIEIDFDNLNKNQKLLIFHWNSRSRYSQSDIAKNLATGSKRIQRIIAEIDDKTPPLYRDTMINLTYLKSLEE